MLTLTELKLLSTKLTRATRPEDIFGERVTDAHTTFRQLARQAHEDLYTGADEKAAAKIASQELNRLWSLARTRIQANTYGTLGLTPTVTPVIVKTKKHTYAAADGPYASGDKSTIYRAINEHGADVLLKISRSHTVNDLLETESNRLAAITKVLNGGEMLRYFPPLIETTSVRDTLDGSNRRINVFEYHDGLVPLTTVMDTFPDRYRWSACRLDR